jgi:hypothetical protein
MLMADKPESRIDLVETIGLTCKILGAWLVKSLDGQLDELAAVSRRLTERNI